MSDFPGADRVKKKLLNGCRYISPYVLSAMFVGVDQLILVSGAAAQMNIPCGQRGDIINTLNDSYAEKPVATGLTQGGGNRNIYVGEWLLDDDYNHANGTRLFDRRPWRLPGGRR